MRTIPSTSETPSELQQFFADIGSVLAEVGTTSQLPEQKDLKRFFAAISIRVAIADKKQRQRDREEASRFNVFHLIDPDENKLSEVLAFLLDPQENHGQGHLFLRLLFQQLKLAVDFKCLPTATIRLEASTHLILNSRRRMDVLVDAGTLVAIENKVDALEQEEQVKDYLEHLRLCTNGSLKKSVLIYLTPNGRPPKSIKSDARLHCWSYQVELREWLENCRRVCQAEKIKDFLTYFIAYIESDLKRKPEASTGEDETNEN